VRRTVVGGPVLAEQGQPQAKTLRASNTLQPLRTAGLYLGAAVLWVLFSDQLAALLIDNPRLLTLAQTLKGWVFVVVTAALIFVLLRRERARCQTTTDHLRQSEQELRDILDAMPVGIALTDGVTIEYINISFSQRFGYSLDEIPTDEQWFLLAYPDPVYRELLIGAWKTEIDRARASNSPIRPLEVKVTCKDGKLRHAIANTQLIGKRIVVILTDITERELLRNELIKMQKLESIGVLAGGIAHDFNNILTGVMGNLSYAQVLLEPGHKARAPLDSAEQASARAAELTRQLLTFARGGEPIKQATSVAALINESMSLVLRGTKVRGEALVDANVWAVEVDSGQISQVLNNIVINAAQAMPDGGVLRIFAENEMVEEGASPALAEGRYVRIRIVDTGCGVAPETLDRIFEPYFTTKESGSGLGLASAYSIIARHGGAIAVESEVGRGAIFILHLPATLDNPSSEPPLETARPGTRSDRPRILVMDDEAPICDIATAMLDFLGYEADACADGAGAVQLYQKALAANQTYAAVVMDLTIPGGMGGKEAARRILAMDPAARLIVSSGYSHDPIMADYQTHGFSGVLAKPYKVMELGRALETALPAEARP
jgi:PAS domain S-box-containing protein